jgi:hypothetical protein
MNARVVRQLSLFAVIFEIACSSSGMPKQESATDAVIPQSVDLDLTKLPKSKQWKPGDSVYEIPDLKQTPLVETRGDPVAPTIFEGRLPQITTATPQTLWLNKNSECSKNSSATPTLYNNPEMSGWIIVHVASLSTPSTGSFLCIAVNRSKDVLSGGWYLYGFKIPDVDLALIDIRLVGKYYELVLELNSSLRTYLVSRNDVQQGKASALNIKRH